MSHKVWLPMLLVCTGAACRGKPSAPAPAAPASRSQPSARIAAPVLPDASARDRPPCRAPNAGLGALERAYLIVAGERGVEELGPDGKVLRVISRTAGHHPRFLGNDEIVTLTLDDPMSGEVKSVRRVSLVTGESSVVARIPRLRCAERAVSLALQSPSDFGLTGDGAYACLALADRNENMASVSVSVQIDLRTGKVAVRQNMGHEKDWGEDRCSIRGASGPELKCSPRQPEPGRSDTPGLDQVPGVPAFEEDGAEAYSLSGDWLVVHGELEDADYIHRPLVLLDRRDGKTYSLRPGPWPKPLTRRQLKRIAKAASEGDPDKAETLIAVGETELRWVRLGDKDALIAEDTLYVPGSPSIKLHGEVAY